MNLANKLTLLRVLMIPAFLGVLYWGGPNSEYIALAIFVTAISPGAGGWSPILGSSWTPWPTRCW